jgi:hypothetical protein
MPQNAVLPSSHATGARMAAVSHIERHNASRPPVRRRLSHDCVEAATSRKCLKPSTSAYPTSTNDAGRGELHCVHLSEVPSLVVAVV